MKQIAKVVAVSAVCAATVYASGWRIPEQSLNSTALSAAYVAGANGADTSYYNPANMAFMPEGAEIETALTYINLPSISYSDSVSSLYDGDSTVENFIMPTFHYVSPIVGENWRFGLSTVAPGGLSKRWDDAYAKATAEEFSLTIVEVNPTASYKFNEQFAVGFGLRGVYIDGTVKSDASDLNPIYPKREMTGDSIDFGYNLALTYKPTESLTLASTYRSKVDMTVESTDGKLSAGGGLITYEGNVNVTIPLPAALTLAAAYDFGNTKVEFVFERTYWSSYKELDFSYDTNLITTYGTAFANFENPRAKNWDDVNAYRIGVTHQYNSKLKLMAAFAYDEAAAPKNTIGFELPDSDAKLYSVGFEYQINQNTKIGLAYLYDQKKSITVDNRTATDLTAPSGTFDDASAHLVTASIKYRF